MGMVYYDARFIHLSSTNANPIQLDHMKDYLVSKDGVFLNQEARVFWT